MNIEKLLAEHEQNQAEIVRIRQLAEAHLTLHRCPPEAIENNLRAVLSHDLHYIELSYSVEKIQAFMESLSPEERNVLDSPVSDRRDKLLNRLRLILKKDPLKIEPLKVDERYCRFCPEALPHALRLWEKINKN